MSSIFAIVALPLPMRREFSYTLPPGIADRNLVGRRAVVPFGHRKLTGVIVGTTMEPPPVEAKAILEILDEEPLVGESILKLTNWIADYYLASWGETLRAALPLGQACRSRRYAVALEGGVGLTDDPFTRSVDQAIRDAGRVPVHSLVRRMGKRVDTALRKLARSGRVEVCSILEDGRIGSRTEIWAEVLPEGCVDGSEKSLRRNAVRQIECLMYLRMKRRVRKSELRARFGGACDALVKKGFVREVEEEILRIADIVIIPSMDDPDPPLTPEQQSALRPVVSAIEEERFEAHLLHGITGSGKTEVYLRAASVARGLGKSVLILVPEISLTPQTVGRFRVRFGADVVVLHSALSAGERHDTWREIHRGRYPVVVGVRSALFAPLSNLGLIVVDEEHDGSYKQGDAPRYHGRDMAVVRAKLEKVPVILGSATPCLESYWNAQRGKYHLAVLPNRIHDRSLPRIELIDFQKVPFQKRVGVLSPLLVERVGETLKRNDQTMIFLNRRGHSAFLHCDECGYVPGCPHCEVTLTFHSRESILRCHYCGTETALPDLCLECGSRRVSNRGIGTQRVEEDLAGAFPGARIARMDLDTTRRRDSARKILSAFADGEIDILLGTQMIAKGHHFPGVSLVGIINADTALHLPDFRAAERTFQLLLQVGGRAGRGERPGEVLIQTFHPEHYTLRAAVHHDFDAFAARELADRKDLGYPPFSRIISLTFRGKNERAVGNAAARFRSSLATNRKAGPLIREVLGPTPAPIGRIRDRFRWKLLIKGRIDRWAALREILSGEIDRFRSKRGRGGVDLIVDVDAFDLL